MDTLPLPAAASAAASALDGDSAIDSLVFALDDGRFAAFYRSWDGRAVLLGTFADPDVAAFVAANRRGMPGLVVRPAAVAVMTRWTPGSPIGLLATLWDGTAYSNGRDRVPS